MVKIILVRHGETEWNKIHRIQGGASDVPLNDAGRLQAGNVAERLKDEKIQAIFSSPLQRALYTAREIARHHGLEVNLAPALREIDAGSLEGFPSTELIMSFDEYICRDNHLQTSGQYPMGDNICDVQKRAWIRSRTLPRSIKGMWS